MGRFDHYEDLVRDRPSRRNSRPRSKDRPAHADAHIGMVTGVDRGRYTTVLNDHAVIAMRAREVGRHRIVVGDQVAMVGDTSGGVDALARIVRVLDRDTVLRRSADDTDRVERVIVANASQLAIVTALADPEPRPRMIDRCLVAAYDAGMDPLLVLTKADLAAPDELIEMYAALEVPYVVIALGPQDSPDRNAAIETVLEHLADRVTVLVGHSGVGKSTLVNALVPSAHRAVGVVNDVTGRGRHTSTSSFALPLVGGGWVVDTPGVRSFGLGHVDPATFIEQFGDLSPGTKDCPRSCSHDEPDCALDTFVASGAAGATGMARLESLRRLLRSRTSD